MTGQQVSSEASALAKYLSMLACALALVPKTQPLADDVQAGASYLRDLSQDQERCADIAATATVGGNMLQGFIDLLNAVGHKKAALALGSHGSEAA